MLHVLVDIQQQMLLNRIQKQTSQPHGVPKQHLGTQTALIQTSIEEQFQARTLITPIKAILMLLSSKLK